MTKPPGKIGIVQLLKDQVAAKDDIIKGLEEDLAAQAAIIFELQTKLVEIEGKPKPKLGLIQQRKARRRKLYRYEN